MTRLAAAVLLALCAAGCGSGPEMQAAANDTSSAECSGTFPPLGAVAPVQVGKNGGAAETGPGC